MLPPTQRRLAGAPPRILALLVVLLSLTIGASIAPATSSAAEPELLTNPDFTAGSTGWGTNRSSEILKILNGGIAQLSTRSGGSATLNDRPSTLRNQAKGTNYVAKARVRTTTPNVPGTLRIREVSGTQVNTSTTHFRLTDTSWRVVTLNLTTVYASSKLDFNLNSYRLPVGRNIQVDWTSFKLATTTDPVPPATGPQQPVDAPVTCKRESLSGTKFGVTLDIPSGLTIQQAWDRANRLYGKPGMLRIFHPGAPSGWHAATVAKGVDLSVSFKIHPKTILSGASDAKLRTWFRSAPKDVTIFWTYFHEPENNIQRGEFTASQYRAAWQRIHKIANEICQTNMHSTLILMDWTLDPRSGRTFDDYYPGTAYIDVLSWDPYNPWRGTIYKNPKAIFEKVVLKSRAEGKPYAIAETGSLLMGNDEGIGRAAWLKSMATYLRQNGALHAAYFDTTVSRYDMRLLDKPSQEAWRGITQGGK